MAASGKHHADHIREALTCPQCSYSLRGLEGAVVTCPECGFVIDVARMVASRWTRPWHRAPGLNILFVPIAWIVITMILLFILLAYETSVVIASPPWRSLSAAGFIFAVWLGWLYMIRNRLDNGLAVPLSLFGHVIFVVYLVAMWLLLSSLGLFVASVGTGMVAAALGACALLLSFALFWVGRRGEKYIASQCIRQYLIDRAKADTMRE